MNIDTCENAGIGSNSNFNTSITGFEISNGSANKKEISNIAKQKYLIKEKLDLLNEKRFLDRQLNSLSDYWDM
ncbi:MULTISPECIES: hypothetical protein [unclassified Colwellia]|uniref:hypothetical protein n=1 Tax=unclassified Colwellia TaxID=196834 RepID=UPI0015F5ECB6|nr:MULTISPECIES: hypothetical protein [unclassified Colwellia]MBA6232036.1 hypothetical protein [Colwellia sp. MB02u-7]MBA6236638.1 hypothetical protein [Colwellia sp. MB02u-11]MBA6254711.1 hypothetical protein [Colwellia sp. MB3u-28]MBA6259221.1 hypothetical protein [Colwellia sp. MB3u-41]MBA6298913.1 hypothetical protein [Colwellia sp. MB3u-22]